MAALRKLLVARAPRVSPLLDDTELQRFFGRRSYRGAVVQCSRYNEGEWLVLLGDAAHSVLPPTGEGINSVPRQPRDVGGYAIADEQGDGGWAVGGRGVFILV